ncbi:MAG: HipA domain-containing protein [Bacteroidales bacterium]|nr:HipA domain-containing protein [Bacteroidales bacterium]
MQIDRCPSTLTSGHDTYCPQALKSLFDGAKVSPYLEFNFSEGNLNQVLMEAMQRISVSGVQEKFSAVVDGGKIRLAKSSERATHILKPAPWDNTLSNRKLMPANEHVTMQIASQVYGIKTAFNGLCFANDGQPVYITRRFDIMPDGTKTEMEDFAVLVGRNEQSDGHYFKYSGCYGDIAKSIKDHIPAWVVDMERFFDLVLFNYIYANGDAHLKNFSIIRYGSECRLSPAYDLINTSLHITGDDFGLEGGLSPQIEKSDVYGRTGHPCRSDFERFGLSIGLSPIRVKRLIGKYVFMPDKVEEIVSRSFLNEKMQRTYLQIVTERIRRFVRVSE